ncbi:amidohydrolase family protein [Variovorax saccharolyticus]|uniref:amidohydrolase family protein n=1 Tax=Variovorax saccharolyticus TaxID=3053516 RepID=UPI0025785BB2|nr:amidohydrolase family protein [Variovorax sp. J31P216]MDM0026427.1 amidohydrolase family protein [Variovorax sp. J31P216]
MKETAPAAPSADPARELPAREEFIIRGGRVLTMDPSLGEFDEADVHVRDGVIVAVGVGLQAPGVAAMDGRNTIVMPGFVDTHWHLWNSSLRALVRGDDAENGYFPVTLRVGPLFTPEDSFRSVRLGLAEGLASGITTVHNWSHNTRSPEHADAELRALHATGVRARFSYGWGQELPLTRTMDLEDLARVRREGLPGDGLLSLGAAVRTPVTNPRGAVPIEVIAAEFEGIRALGLPITMHARPGVVSVLEGHGLLGPDLQLVHPQGISVEERRLLAERRTTMSCSPVIEMLYAQATRGEIQFQELLEREVLQSLSVDSSAASANADFFNCMRALLWSHKQRFGSRVPLSPRRLLELATIDGARDLGIAELTGSLTPGKRADLILVRTTDPNIGPVIDPAFALVYSAQPSNVDTVIVDGRVLVREGRFTALDARQVMRDAEQSVHGLVSRSRAGQASGRRGE